MEPHETADTGVAFQMLEDLLSPVGLISISVASVLVALIPAIVIKALMGTIFFRPVSYLTVLLALAVSGFLAVFALGAYTFFGGPSIDAMSNAQVAIWTVGGFLFQALCLKVIATGPRMIMISLWKWCAVLILQYVVYAIIGLIFIAVAG
jgi:hypothetical protein